MSFQVGIGSLGGTVFFQVGLCTPLGTMVSFEIYDGITWETTNCQTLIDFKGN